jgi:hypothetical protein
LLSRAFVRDGVISNEERQYKRRISFGNIININFRIACFGWFYKNGTLPSRGDGMRATFLTSPTETITSFSSEVYCVPRSARSVYHPGDKRAE